MESSNWASTTLAMIIKRKLTLEQNLQNECVSLPAYTGFDHPLICSKCRILITNFAPKIYYYSFLQSFLFLGVMNNIFHNFSDVCQCQFAVSDYSRDLIVYRRIL